MIPRSFIYLFLIYACHLSTGFNIQEPLLIPFGYLYSQSKSEHGRALRSRKFAKIADICSVDLFIGYCHGLPAYTVLRPAVWILKPLRLLPLHCEHFVTLGASWRGRNFQGSTGLQCCHWHLSQWPRVPWMQRVCKKFFIFGRLLLFVKQFAVFGSGGLWRRGVLLPHNEDGQTRWLRTRDRSLMKQR